MKTPSAEQEPGKDVSESMFEPSATKTRTAHEGFKRLVRDPWAWTTLALIITLIVVIVLDLRVHVTSASYRDAKNASAQQETTPTPSPEAPYATSEKIRVYAEELGLNIEQFDGCFAKKNIQPIKDDITAASTIGITGTPSFVINGELIIGAQPYDEFKRVIDHKLANTTNTDGTEPKTIDIEGQPLMGKTEAPVTIVEFSDFQCPYCQRFAKDAHTKIVEDYVKTGKAKLVFRDMVIQGHYNAPIAAVAAECANEQGKFWEYYDILFERQGEWSISDPTK